MKSYGKVAYEPYEFELYDEQGEVYEIVSNKMTTDRVNEISKIDTNSKLLPGEKITKMCVVYFGKNEKFWSDFDMKLLNEIMEDFREFNTKKKKK